MEKGVLMPVSALSGEYGIGNFGRDAYRFVDWVVKRGFTLWQVLPMCVTSFGDSPYQSPSAFAGNPYHIDLDALRNAGLLTQDELPHYPAGRVDYAALYHERWATLKKAYARFEGGEDYAAFIRKNVYWLDDYALFMTTKAAYNNVSLSEWPTAVKHRDPAWLGPFCAAHADEIKFHRFTQYLFFTQWAKVKAYAAAKGVRIIGDMPIYVAYDSADVWCRPEMFLLDEDMNPTAVAGVPPDDFSATGQLWGNPLYDWAAMRADGYDWWIKRLRAAGELYDIVRIDHFRGFAGYYTVPFGSTDATVGKWETGPGIELFEAVQAACDVPVIAEDLGAIDDAVRELVRKTGYPSMKVMQFGLAAEDGSEHLPANFPEHCIAYTGTHDNDTALGWFKSLPPDKRRLVRKRLGRPRGNPVPAMIDMLFASRAEYAVVPMPDFLGLDSVARINTPATLGGNNWCWRLAAIPKK